MISLKQLSYALAVEKTLHFKKAADACHVSQSALSSGLTELEKQLNVQIFERDNKKVLITPMGRTILERAREIMLQVTDLEHLAGDQNSPLDFPLSVGVIPTIAPYLLPRLFPLLREEHPQAQIKIIEEQSHLLVEMVKNGEIDTAILALPYDCEGLLSLEFWQEDFYWVALKGEAHTEQTEITSNELNQANLMLLNEGHCLKDHILAACKLPRQSANHGFGAASLNTIIQMVQGRLGTTLIPQMALEQLTSQNDELCALHLKEPGPHRRIAFIIRPNFCRMQSVEALMKLCKRALGNK